LGTFYPFTNSGVQTHNDAVALTGMVMLPRDLRKLYEEKTGQPWDAEKGVIWLNKNYEHLDLVTRASRLEKSAHITLSDKVGWLSQQFCYVCNPGFPISTFPIRIEPKSWQSLEGLDKRAFKAAIAKRLSDRPHKVAPDEHVCLTFLFVCSASRNVRDLDNMAKLVMDSLKGIVMGDDRNVDHLNLMRFRHNGEEEFLYVQISNSNINDHRDVVYPEMRHVWGVGEPLKPGDFRDSV
jgi:Holliday junction resolvase RusA-like endonuclease